MISDLFISVRVTVSMITLCRRKRQYGENSRIGAHHISESTRFSSGDERWSGLSMRVALDQAMNSYVSRADGGNW